MNTEKAILAILGVGLGILLVLNAVSLRVLQARLDAEGPDTPLLLNDVWDIHVPDPIPDTSLSVCELVLVADGWIEDRVDSYKSLGGDDPYLLGLQHARAVEFREAIARCRREGRP